jgi:glycosyltransferase involved in cell wall biosynthesis
MTNRKASSLNKLKIYHIPNGVDCSLYLPLDKIFSQNALGLPKNKHYLLFSAVNLKSRTKGGDILRSALDALPENLKKDFVLLLLGNNGEYFSNIGIRTECLGYIGNPKIKSLVFSAADLFVFPSRAESFGQVILESLACGTPVVAQNIGPIPELVRPGLTGYLAEPENVSDFAYGIQFLLQESKLRKQMSVQCRTVASTEYSVELEIERHIELYKEILK